MLILNHSYEKAALWLAWAEFQVACWRDQVERLPEAEARLEGLEAASGWPVLGPSPGFRGLWPMLLGDLEGARARCTRFLDGARRARNPYNIITFSMCLAAVQYQRGDLRQADEAIALAQEWAEGQPDPRIDEVRYLLSMARGQLQEARTQALAVLAWTTRVNRSPNNPFSQTRLALVERRLGNAEDGDTAFQKAIQREPRKTSARLLLYYNAVLGLEAAARRERSVLEACKAVLAPHADLLLMWEAGTQAATCVRRALGVMACVLGDWDEAVDHLERGVAFCEEKGLRTDHPGGGRPRHGQASA